MVKHDISVIDNFLEPNIFDKLSNDLLGEDLMYSYGQIHDGDEYGRHYCHNFYLDDMPVSDFYEQIDRTFRDALSVNSWVRIKLNSKIHTNEIIEYPLHQDDVCKNVAIYYLNTCDGYTYFKGGTKVESIANRIIIFPSEVWHGGTSVTNTDRRVVINFNYY